MLFKTNESLVYKKVLSGFGIFIQLSHKILSVAAREDIWGKPEGKSY